jgi:hypothetical protein
MIGLTLRLQQIGRRYKVGSLEEAFEKADKFSDKDLQTVAELLFRQEEKDVLRAVNHPQFDELWGRVMDTTGMPRLKAEGLLKLGVEVRGIQLPPRFRKHLTVNPEVHYGRLYVEDQVYPLKDLTAIQKTQLPR